MDFLVEFAYFSTTLTNMKMQPREPPAGSETLLTMSAYSKGTAPVQLVNQTKSVMIEYAESGIDGRQFLAPMEST